MTENVYLFVPNLIGYARIVLAFFSFYHMKDSPNYFAMCYLFSSLLDQFDGYFARKLNQISKFGAILDMLIDRCVTICLMVALSDIYPSYRIIFQFLITLDVSSHWLHLYSSVMKGEQCHKITSNSFLKLYYESRPVLIIMCLGNELFFVALYSIYFSKGIHEYNTLFGFWSLLVYATFPIFALKQFISVVQLVIASRDIVAFDVIERRKAKS